MLPFEEALRTVLDSAHRLADERVDIRNAVNRVLAEDVESNIDIPPFDKSLRDGYACRRADLANELTVVETIPAGYTPSKAIEPSQCAKIMTGAVMPEGADCVLMREYVETLTEDTVRFAGEDTDDYISRRAEDVAAGQVVLSQGTLLKPHHIAILATVGRIRPRVSKAPRVGVLATGSELIDPAGKPKLSQIRNSNSCQLVAQIEQMGAIATNYGIVEDTEEAIDGAFKKAATENNVVLVSGGVSVGDFDFVPGILKQNGFDLLFEKVAVKPGKPTVFGVSGEVYCFGLPGNPVSTFVQFEILMKPFLYRLMGYDYQPHDLRLPLDGSLKRKDTERQEWFPVTITEARTVKLVPYHGSGHISALADADGLIPVDVGVAQVEEGTIVQIRLI
ncbi:MAG: molybdopterin molybdotransferase MoeA [Sedimentisphaerales bacterium]